MDRGGQEHESIGSAYFRTAICKIPSFYECCGLTWQAAKWHADICPLPPWWDGGANWVKNKTCGLRRSNRGKKYTKQVRKNSIAHKCLANPWIMVGHPWPTPLSFYCTAQCHILWNIHFASLGQLSLLCPLPDSCALTASSLAGMRSWKVLDLA